MLMAQTTLAGPTQIVGTLRVSCLKIVNPAQPDGDRPSEWLSEQLARPTLQASEIFADSVEIPKGARVLVNDLYAKRVRVEGTLEAHCMEGEVLTAAEGAVVSVSGRALCRYTNVLTDEPHTDDGFYTIATGWTTELRGVLLVQAEEDAGQAAQILMDSEKDPGILQRINFQWVERALSLAGWECRARSSSGNGCNYCIAGSLAPNYPMGYNVYVPLRTGIYEYDKAMRNVLTSLSRHRYEDPKHRAMFDEMRARIADGTCTSRVNNP